MKQKFLGWNNVTDQLNSLATEQAESEKKGIIVGWQLNEGQCASLRAIGKRIPRNGLIIADEVGMGKTRIAVAVARSVVRSNGRVAILVPPGLGFQWRDELRDGGVDTPPLLRSLWQYLAAWQSEDAVEQQPWFDQQVLLISHAFTNWRLGEKSDPWRWALLPELYARWRKQRGERFPRGYHGNENLDDGWVQRAAQSIAEVIWSQYDSRAKGLIEELAESTP